MTISYYLLKEELGRGSMGVVYKAEDTRLGRTVALKLMPQELAEDPVATERFHREARAASMLNHPNICTIYGSGEENGQRYIAMELLDGVTLRQRIGESPLGSAEILAIALPLASALAAAHEAGTIHRNIKSSNIFLTRLPSGDVVPKICDFGLSKPGASGGAADVPVAAASEEDAQTVRWTLVRHDSRPEELAHLSPEQTMMFKLDARTDVFSFGVVLYQMATGRMPFRGETQRELFQAIRNQAPKPVAELNPAIPAELAKIVAKALEKKADLRYQTAGEMQTALRQAQRQLEGSRGTAALNLRGGIWRRILLWAALGASAVAVPFLAWISISRPKSTDLKHMEFTQLTDQPEQVAFPSLAPDGKSFAFASADLGRSDVCVQRVGGKNRINLTAASMAGRSNTQPVYSPDGEAIAFRSEGAGGGIFIMGATGEAARRVIDAGYNPSWSPDGKQLIYSTESVERPEMRPGFAQLWRVNVSTGERRLVYGGDAVQPAWSPHGYRIAFWSQSSGRRDIATVPAETGEPVAVTKDAYMNWNPVWSPDGRYLYFASDRGGSMGIWRVPVDERTGKVLGALEPVATPSQDSSGMSFSRDGRHMTYLHRAASQNFQTVAFDPVARRAVGGPSTVTQGPRQVMNPDISPDAQWIAFVQWGRTEDICVMKMDGTGMRQLTDDVYKDRGPRWSPDGKRIAFYSNRSGSYQTWLIHPDGTGLEQLTHYAADVLYPVWSPDGGRIAYSVQGEAPAILDLATRQTRPLVALKRSASWFEIWSWSADGRALAGVERTPDGRYIAEIVYDMASGQLEYLADHGTYPVWLRDNRTLLVPHADRIFALDVRSKALTEAFSLGRQPVSRLFAISPDNRTLLFGLPVTEADIWLATLDAR